MGFLYGLGLVVDISVGSIAGILIRIVILLPIVALAIWKESKGLRYFNFLLQAIIFGALLIFLIVLVISIDSQDVPELFCWNAPTVADSNNMDKQSCKKAVRLFLYGAWAIATFLILPLQFLIMSIFKAYHEELKKDDKGF